MGAIQWEILELVHDLIHLRILVHFHVQQLKLTVINGLLLIELLSHEISTLNGYLRLQNLLLRLVKHLILHVMYLRNAWAVLKLFYRWLYDLRVADIQRNGFFLIYSHLVPSICMFIWKDWLLLTHFYSLNFTMFALSLRLFYSNTNNLVYLI